MSERRPDMVNGLGDDKDFTLLQTRLEDLVSLGGRAKVAGMLSRFAETLEQLLHAAPDGPWSADEAHRLVGLAGILGFAEVERRWRAVEIDRPSSKSLAAARTAAQAAIYFAEAWR